MAKTAFYICGAAYVSAVWLFHVIGGKAIRDWLWDWQSLLGALIGGGAAIIAGRYALHAVRAQTEATLQLRRKEQAEDEMFALHIFMEHTKEIWMSFRTDVARFDIFNLGAGNSRGAYERFIKATHRIERYTRDMMAYTGVGGNLAGTIRASIIGIENAASRIADESEVALKASSGKKITDADVRYIDHNKRILVMSLSELARTAQRRALDLCPLTGDVPDKVMQFGFVVRGTAQLAEKYSPPEHLTE